MSAAEVIEQIKRLPAESQDEVLAFLQIERRKGKSAPSEVRYASDAEFEKVAEKVLREHADLFRRLAE